MCWRESQSAAWLLANAQVEAQLAELERRPGAADIMVVGAGYAGIELVTSIADRMQGAARIRVISSGRHHKPLLRVLPCLPHGAGPYHPLRPLPYVSQQCCPGAILESIACNWSVGGS